jgi:Ca-activated chloride channel family protein
MFSTPIVYAGWKSEMERLGFVNREVTIEEVLQAVESKKTKVWVTNPTQSNSGATVLFGFLNHFAGNGPGVALTQAQLDSEPVQAGITRFSQAFDHTPPSTGTLMNECTAHPDQCKTLFTYEDLVIEKNRELVAAGKEPLYAVYPKGSLAISDAPLGFLPHGDNPGKEATFKKLQDYLLTDAAQQKLQGIGRRPITSIGLSLPNAPKDVFNPDWGIQATLREQPIVYPAVAVIQAALNNYQTKYRTPADVVYCIDGSGSMGDNDGWKGVLQAAGLLFDPAQSAQVLLQVNPADRTTVLIFADKVKAGPWTVDGNDPAKLLDLKKKIEGQGPGGGTGIYRCLTKGAETFKTTPSGHKPLMILMTDGHNTDGGKDLNAIKAAGVPVIAIGFGGDIDEGAMQEIASQTGGVYIRSNDLAGALRQATGYK